MLRISLISVGHSLFILRVRWYFSVVLHFFCGNLLLFDIRVFWVLCLSFSYKGNFRMIGDDLVNSYHLLLCCLDLIFANAIICPNRGDLLNPSFKGKTLFIFENQLSVFRKSFKNWPYSFPPVAFHTLSY